MPCRQSLILIIIIFLSLYQANPNLFRRSWKIRAPQLNSIDYGLANRADFIAMTRFDVPVFLKYIVDPVRHILNKTNHEVDLWLNDDNTAVFQYNAKHRKKTLDVNNRCMRALMFNTSFPSQALKFMFGQCKSAIYEDADRIMRVLAKANAAKFRLPLAGTAEYNANVGIGVLNDTFDTAVLIMDGHKVPIQRPQQQREYYDNRKKMHCKNYLILHDGNGIAKYIHGGVPGRYNDITLWRDSSLYRQAPLFVAPNNWILCDGAWRNEGPPLLCGFTDRPNGMLNALELVFNYLHSEARVISENYYGRLHMLWPILNYWTLRLDKLDTWMIALAFLTNVHCTYQSPLRE